MCSPLTLRPGRAWDLRPPKECGGRNSALLRARDGRGPDASLWSTLRGRHKCGHPAGRLKERPCGRAGPETSEKRTQVTARPGPGALVEPFQAGHQPADCSHCRTSPSPAQPGEQKLPGGYRLTVLSVGKDNPPLSSALRLTGPLLLGWGAPLSSLLTGDLLLCAPPTWLGFPPQHSALQLRDPKGPVTAEALGFCVCRDGSRRSARGKCVLRDAFQPLCRSSGIR